MKRDDTGIERRSTRSHFVENFWKRPWNCRETTEGMYGSHNVQWLFPYCINWLVFKMEVHEIL